MGPPGTPGRPGFNGLPGNPGVQGQKVGAKHSLNDPSPPSLLLVGQKKRRLWTSQDMSGQQVSVFDEIA